MLRHRMLICFLIFCTLLIFKANSHAKFQEGEVLIYNVPESQSTLMVEVISADNNTLILDSHFESLSKRMINKLSLFYYTKKKSTVLKSTGDGIESLNFNKTSLVVAHEPTEDITWGKHLLVTEKRNGNIRDRFMILIDHSKDTLPPVYDMIGFLFSFHLQKDLNSVPDIFFLLESKRTPRVGIGNIGTGSYTAIYPRPGESSTQQCTKFELFWQNKPNKPWAEVWISNRDRIPLKINLKNITFNFRRKYSREENIQRLEWITWQGEMERAFSAAERYEDNRNYSYKEKLDKWTEFIADYKDDNPESTKDNDLKIKAHARKKYWLDSDKSCWASRQNKMDKAFEDNEKKDKKGKLSPTRMAIMWTSFITDYNKYNNIYSNRDEDLRKQAQQKADEWSGIKIVWAERQKKMKETFNDEKRNEANTELSSIEKANNWEKFQSANMTDNPDSKDDDEIREEVAKRVKKWKELDRTEWKVYQQKMKKVFNEAKKQAKKDELSAKEKAELWKTFLDNYKIDNPHSKKDTKLINKAENKVKKWEETDRADWKAYQQNMEEAFDEAKKQAGKDELSAKEKAELWKTFLDNYKIDNPHSEKDTKLINKATNYYNKWIGKVEESEETETSEADQETPETKTDINNGATFRDTIPPVKNIINIFLKYGRQNHVKSV